MSFHREKPPHIVEKYLIRPTERKMSTTEFLFWHDRGYDHKTIPQAILIATASTRKIMLMNAYLNAQFDEYGEVRSFEFSEQVPAEYRQAFISGEPLDLRNFLVEKIENADGAYKGLPLFIGYFQGVKVYAVSTSGETKGGQDPEEQARLKAEYLCRRKYKNLPFVIMSVDALVEIEKGKRLGKVANEVDFPKRVHFPTDESYEQAMREYLLVYVQTMLAKAEREGFTALTGVARVDASVDGEGATMTTQVVRQYQPDAAKMRWIIEHAQQVVDLQASGGGIVQQALDWDAIGDGSLHPYAKKVTTLMEIMGAIVGQTLEFAAIPRSAGSIATYTRAAV